MTLRAKIVLVCSSVLALASACSSNDGDSSANTAGSGGGGSSAGSAGTSTSSTGGSTSATGGSSSLGGSPATGTGGASGSGNVTCGSATCTPATGEGGGSFPACCRDAATSACGRKTWDGGECLALHQAGELDAACPDVQNQFVAQTYPGCCRSDGTCGGMQHVASELGCLEPGNLGADTTSTSCSYAPAADAGGRDGGR